MTRLTCGERINVPMNTLRLFAASLFLVVSSTFAGETQITHADGKEAVKLVAEKKVAVIDVRTPAEFGLAHIDGASNIDFNAPDFETKLKAIDKTKPVLGQISPGRGDLLRHWPEMLGATRSRDYGDGSIVKLTPNDTLNFVQGEARPVLERLYVSTEELTGGVCTLMPGHRGENRTHPGEKIIFALNGRLNVYLPDTYDWFELHEKDALYLPSNTVHQCWNYGDKETSFAFKLVPTY